MKYTKQSDYNQFKCIAGECPSSCCKGWQIVIDDETLDKYEEVTNPFIERLVDGIDVDESCFLQENGRCVMLNSNDLCDLQLNLGEDMLCDTCRMYPRHTEEFDGVREYSLSLSCPEAVNMLFSRADLLSFEETLTDEEEYDTEGYEEFDYVLYDLLLEVRETLYQMLGDQSRPLDIRLCKVLEIASKLQDKIDSDEHRDASDVLKKDWHSEQECLRECFNMLCGLEQLDDSWQQTLDNTRKYCFEENGECVLPDNLELAMTNVAIQLIYTYFCGAVYDGLAFSKAALAVCFVRWTILISLAENNGKPDKDIFIRTVYRLAKELEHSDENLIAMDDWFDINRRNMQ